MVYSLSLSNGLSHLFRTGSTTSHLVPRHSTMTPTPETLIKRRVANHLQFPFLPGQLAISGHPITISRLIARFMLDLHSAFPYLGATSFTRVALPSP